MPLEGENIKACKKYDKFGLTNLIHMGIIQKNNAGKSENIEEKQDRKDIEQQLMKIEKNVDILLEHANKNSAFWNKLEITMAYLQCCNFIYNYVFIVMLNIIVILNFMKEYLNYFEFI